MKILLIVILLSTIIAAQNKYNIQPGVKNNKIILQLSNISTTEKTNNIAIKLIKSSNRLKFNQTEQTVENITEGTEKEASFSFDVDYNIKTTEADTIEFMITDNRSIYQTKQFILQYSVPTEYKLEQNYPNPFNPSTKIRYSIPRSTEYYSVLQNVTLKIYDILGNELTTLVNEQKAPGYYEVDFNASSFASGVYIYRLQSGSFISTKKMLMIKWSITLSKISKVMVLKRGDYFRLNLSKIDYRNSNKIMIWYKESRTSLSRYFCFIG